MEHILKEALIKSVRLLDTSWDLDFEGFRAGVPSGHPNHVLGSWPPRHQMEHILKEALIKSVGLLDTSWDLDFEGFRADVPSGHPSHVAPPGNWISRKLNYHLGNNLLGHPLWMFQALPNVSFGPSPVDV